MTARVFFSLLIAVLAVGGYWAQEKPGPKQEPPAGPSASAPAPNPPHTYNISPEDKERKNPVRLTDVAVERGKKLFLSQCAMCHGTNGDGKGDLATELNIPPPDFTKPEVLSKRTDGELFTIIGQGSETMPGQGKRLQERRKWQIVHFLRTIEGKTPAKATDKEKEEDENIKIVPQ